ncbi:biopolymer transporter ExbD [Halalkalibaculum sp. DA3122]|uniref:biopolymer transporter ExbD n=1 Tax=unclassified Halalkalibaculum TaxID=2964617 RepID=UPI003754AD34
MINKKRQREEPELGGAGMSDIAFLLLIFFLLVTTIDVDTGIGLVLPPEPEQDQEPPPIKERNMLKILVNAQGMVLLDEEPTSLPEVKDRVKEFIDNNGQDPDLSESPDKAIVSIKTDRQTPYSVYIDMLDEVMGAYKELRDLAAQDRYGTTYDALEDESEAKQQIRDLYPKKISIAEPDQG